MSTTTTTQSPRLDSPTTTKLVAWGVTVWLAVTLTFRLIGHVVLDPSNTLLLTGFFVAVIPLMAAVTYPVYRYLQLPHAARPTAAAAMSIPGMFLDVVLLQYASTVFPALETSMVVTYAAVLFFGYAIVLLTGFVPRGTTVSD